MNKKRILKVGLGLVAAGLAVRLAPYLAPIRAQDLVQNGQAVTFLDRNGLPLGTLLSRDQDHTAVVPLSAISPHFIQAILAAEDRRFYQHGPLDLRAIARSTLEAFQAGRIVSGASTIAMQLARMLDPGSAGVGGKVREVWTAWRLAAGMSQSDILEAYCNRLPMGGNIYGIEAASRVYFGVAAQDLTVAQATLLAGLPNNPTHLNPYFDASALKARQAYVLDQMVRDRTLTRTQADRVYQEGVTWQPRQQGILAAPHFLFWAASQLPDPHPAQIRTTLDLPLQQFAETQVRQLVRSLAPHNVHQAAVLVVENASGAVLAYVGSPDYFALLQPGRNDGVQALRQPGSALKPFLYALALNNRTIRPNTILQDVPTYYAIPGAKLYSPTDYSETFAGPVRVRLALANSLNVPAVKVLERMGVPTFLDWLHRLGFTHLDRPPEYYGLGLALGSGEVSLWELAQAYRTMARFGTQTPLAFTDKTLEQKSAPARLLGNPTDWALVVDMLSDRFARARAFGVESVLSLPFPTAVKTGTSSNYRDTWTVGFSTEYTVATWVGNFNGAPMQKVSGVTGAAPLWNRMMLHLHEDREPGTFAPPTELVRRPICATTGERPNAKCLSVVQEYFDTADLLAYAHPPEPTHGKSRSPADAEAGSLKIAFPKEDDYFILNGTDPTRLKVQPSGRLEFKLAQASDQLAEWRLNGTVIARQSQASLFWPMQEGQWTLEVRSGGKGDRVHFQVQKAEPPSGLSGFSVR
ncbi:MAG: penicillin-binding protein 1C [Thermosynechococcaceae cyanobacterium]